jgi:hypothetical protein
LNRYQSEAVSKLLGAERAKELVRLCIVGVFKAPLGEVVIWKMCITWIWGQCYDFLNISAKSLAKIFVFLPKLLLLFVKI